MTAYEKTDVGLRLKMSDLIADDQSPSGVSEELSEQLQRLRMVELAYMICMPAPSSVYNPRRAIAQSAKHFGLDDPLSACNHVTN